MPRFTMVVNYTRAVCRMSQSSQKLWRCASRCLSDGVSDDTLKFQHIEDKQEHNYVSDKALWSESTDNQAEVTCEETETEIENTKAEQPEYHLYSRTGFASLDGGDKDLSTQFENKPKIELYYEDTESEIKDQETSNYNEQNKYAWEVETYLDQQQPTKGHVEEWSWDQPESKYNTHYSMGSDSLDYEQLPKQSYAFQGSLESDATEDLPLSENVAMGYYQSEATEYMTFDDSQSFKPDAVEFMMQHYDPQAEAVLYEKTEDVAAEYMEPKDYIGSKATDYTDAKNYIGSEAAEHSETALYKDYQQRGEAFEKTEEFITSEATEFEELDELQSTAFLQEDYSTSGPFVESTDFTSETTVSEVADFTSETAVSEVAQDIIDESRVENEDFVNTDELIDELARDFKYVDNEQAEQEYYSNVPKAQIRSEAGNEADTDFTKFLQKVYQEGVPQYQPNETKVSQDMKITLQPTDQPPLHLTNQPKAQCGNQLTDQSKAQPGNQLTTPPKAQPDKQLTAQPTNQPGKQLTAQPTNQPTAWPITEGPTLVQSKLDDQESRTLMRYALLQALRKLDGGCSNINAQIIITKPSNKSS